MKEKIPQGRGGGGGGGSGWVKSLILHILEIKNIYGSNLKIVQNYLLKKGNTLFVRTQ